jgi:NADP-dependent 3-hydroxy acid dehydrogenase YdfG
MFLKDKVVVITGAASGIGKALALGCAQRGAKLLLADIDATGLRSLAASLREAGSACHECSTDTGHEAAIQALASECQRVYGAADVLINNAGVALVAPIDRASTADAQWLMNINFWGVVHGCRAFLPQLRSRPEAVLVNISSIFAMISMPTQGYYNASKAAVRAFSDALREELRDSTVRVLCVHPGGIKTNIANQARVVDLGGIASSPEQMRAHFLQAAITTPDEAARVILGAIEQGRTRVLIGRDAKIADLLYRFVPTRASQWITRLARRQQRRRAT